MPYFTYGTQHHGFTEIWTQLQSTVPPQGATEQHTCTHALFGHHLRVWNSNRDKITCIVFCCAVWQVVQVCPGMYYISLCCVHICHSVTVGSMLCGKGVHVVTYYSKVSGINLYSQHILEKLGLSWYRFTVALPSLTHSQSLKSKPRILGEDSHYLKCNKM